MRLCQTTHNNGGTESPKLTTLATAETGNPNRPTDPKQPQARAYVQDLSPPPPAHSCAHPLLVVSFSSTLSFARSASAFDPRGRSSVGDSGGVASQPKAWPVFVNAVVAAVVGGVEAADADLAASLLKGARCCCGKERFSMSDSAERVDSAD